MIRGLVKSVLGLLHPDISFGTNMRARPGLTVQQPDQADA